MCTCLKDCRFEGHRRDAWAPLQLQLQLGGDLDVSQLRTEQLSCGRREGDVEVAINPEELEGLDDAAVQALYRQRLASQQAGGREVLAPVLRCVCYTACQQGSRCNMAAFRAWVRAYAAAASVLWWHLVKACRCLVLAPALLCLWSGLY